MRAREGDFIEVFKGGIFDVKGLVHPPTRIIAFLRYFPDQNGNRTKDGLSYRKVYALSERYTLLQQVLPQYLIHDEVFDTRLCEVPTGDVKTCYKPPHRLTELRHREDELDHVETHALRFMELLKAEANVAWDKLGISGSILVNLHTETSDIDPLVYGSENCYQVYQALASLLKSHDNPVKPYNLKGLKTLFDFRSKDTSMRFEDFVRTESRKISQGTFMGRDYFVRFVKDWNEIETGYDTIRYKSAGYARIKARVVNDSEAIFTPCCYPIDEVDILEGPHHTPIEEIVSFRGRFCEQAKTDELVIAQGKLESVHKKNEATHYRLLLGNQVSDYMILV